MNVIFTKRYLLLLFVLGILNKSLNAQLIISTTGTPVTQNFDGMGTSATATLPTGFKFGTNWTLGTTATSFAAGTSGTGVLTSGSQGGNYNFANGVTGTATDRALGFLNSNSFGSPQSIILAFQNTTGVTITSLNITFDYEKYRSGSRQFDWTFFHGAAVNPTIAAAAGNQSYVADAANTTIYNPPTTTSKTVSLTGLSILDNGIYYLKWTFTGLAGSSNGQGIGIDNFSITANPPTVFITAAPDIITGLDYIQGAGPSVPQSFVVTGTGTTNPLSAAPPASFEIATASAGPYSTSAISINSGATIYVRTVAGLTANPYNGYVTLSGGGAPFSKLVAVSGTVTSPYCTPSITNTCDEYIKNVTLNTINNSSGCATNGAGYSNYTTITTPVIKGQNYSLSINVGQTADPNSGYSTDDIRVWADWNQDGQFTDATESVISVNDNGGAGSYNFTVPTTAVTGSVPIRIRLVKDNETSSCGASTYGETEDYVLVVSDACVSAITVSNLYPSTGPANTLVKIIGGGFTGATAVSFNGIAAASFTVVSATEIDAKVPAGAGIGPIKITDNTGCSYTTASNFTSISQTGTCPAGPGSNTDLMITEISDPQSGNTHYIEVYNGTSSVITLTGKYSLQVFNDPSTTTTISLTGTIGTNTVKVYYAGSNGGLANGTPLGLPNGFNDNDEIRLIKNGIVLDRVKTPNSVGYNYKRLPTVTSPNSAYTVGEWTIISPETTQDVSNIGIYTTNPGYTITANPTDVTSCAISMSVTAAPTTGLTYQWKYQNGTTGTAWTSLTDGTTALPGATVAGSTSATLSISGDLTAYNSYQFYVEVINGTCSKASNAAAFVLGATRYFKSNSPVTGNWTSASSWLMSTSSSGPWVTTCTYPTAANSDYISIESGDVITLDLTNLTLDQVTIQNGGYMKILPAVTLTVGNGAAGSDFSVLGTLEDGANSSNSVNFNTGATWSIGAAGTLVKTNASGSNIWQSSYETGIANIPATANWILRYTGASANISLSSTGAYYPNLIFESTSGNWNPAALVRLTGSSGYTTIKGKLDIGGTGSGTVSTLINENTNAQPVLIMDSLIVRAGSAISNAGATNGTGFEVRGNVLIQGTLTVNSGSTGIVKLSGTVPQNISGTGMINLQNFTVTNAAGVNILRNLTVGGTATLTQGIVNPKTNILSLASNIILGSGKIDGDSATLNMTGIIPQTIPANTLVLNNLLNLIISNGDAATGVTLAGALDIYGSLTYSVNNSILNTNNNLTLKSGISQTAWIGDMTNHTINGNTTVERYIATGTGSDPKEHAKTWQLLATPTNGGQTIKQSWMEGATASNVTDHTVNGDPVSGYGTMITSDLPGAVGVGFDAYTPKGPSLKTYNTATGDYSGPLNTNLPLFDKRGYFVFVRGDRSVYTSTGTASHTILRTKGQLFTPANIPMQTTVPANQFESIGNPYAAPIDMTKISATGGSVNQYFYVWDPRVGGNYNYGAFVTFQFDGTNYEVQTNGGKTYPANGTPYNYIQSGQAFFMHATASPGTVKFLETAKAGATFSGTIATRHINDITTPTTFHNNIEKNLRISLQTFDTDGSIVTQDEALNQFGDYSNKVDGMDAIKQMNTGENLSIKTDDKLLVIEKRRTPERKDTIFLNITNLRAQKYQLSFDAENLGIIYEGFVEDLYTNTRSPLKSNGNTLIEFTVDGNPGSYSSDRFRIVFSHRKLLPSIYTFLKAYKLDKNINVEWKVNNEHDIKRYEVEKSIDGIHFTSLTFTNPSDNNGNSTDYVVTDNKPVSGFNYYRIKIINFDESVSFTTIVKEKISFIEKDIEITPNPITNNQIQIRFINESAGIYSLRLLNNLGQDIIQKQITRQDGNSTETIKLRPNLAHELYKLEIVKPDGTLKILNVLY